DEHQDHWPEQFPDANGDQSFFVEEEPRADAGEDQTARSLAAVARLHDHQSADEDERHRPEAQNVIRFDDAQPIERKRESEQDDRDTEDGARRHDERAVLIHVYATLNYDLMKMLPI